MKTVLSVNSTSASIGLGIYTLNTTQGLISRVVLHERAAICTVLSQWAPGTSRIARLELSIRDDKGGYPQPSHAETNAIIANIKKRVHTVALDVAEGPVEAREFLVPILLNACMGATCVVAHLSLVGPFWTPELVEDVCNAAPLLACPHLVLGGGSLARVSDVEMYAPGMVDMWIPLFAALADSRVTQLGLFEFGGCVTPATIYELGRSAWFKKNAHSLDIHGNRAGIELLIDGRIMSRSVDTISVSHVAAPMHFGGLSSLSVRMPRLSQLVMDGEVSRDRGAAAAILEALLKTRVRGLTLNNNARTWSARDIEAVMRLARRREFNLIGPTLFPGAEGVRFRVLKHILDRNAMRTPPPTPAPSSLFRRAEYPAPEEPVRRKRSRHT